MRECIRKGIWCSGMILPSRRALAKEFGVDLNTLQRAIAPMLADGTLIADAGRATFVAERPALATPAGRILDSVRGGRQRSSFEGARIGIVAQLSIRHSRYTDNESVYTMLSAIERTLAPHGISTTVSDISALGRRDIRTVDAMRSLVELGVDGLLVLTGTSPEAVALSRELRMPVVFTGPLAVNDRVAYVHYDNHDAGYQAAAHLIDKGCRRLLFFSARSADWVTTRLAGVRAAIDATSETVTLDVQLSPRPMPQHDLDQVPDAIEFARSLVEGYRHIDGVVAANDNCALGYLEAAREHGMTSPDDFLLVGFDDARQVVTEAGITSLRPPFEQMAVEAASLILKGLADEDYSKKVTLFTHLIPRDTTYRRALERIKSSAPALAGE